MFKKGDKYIHFTKKMEE